ncbi:hypothetical protein EG327_003914 [Venturia inaequalis]|uniref:Inositol-phosphate phosphatase n=1 Tax=Venturia inaequalis TaxID=5025 RepID=A0A8H3VRF7_VENIN|nr:hypothetical protein EG327_003914 [Venturia inaequalis]
MSAIGETELEEIYAFAIQLGKEAGDLLLAAADLRMQGDGRKEQTSVEKASSVDLVTQTDEATAVSEKSNPIDTSASAQRVHLIFFLNMATEVGGRGGKGGMVHGVRMLGSATMDLAYTAMGSFDIWWEGGCWEWDVAAGICILQEAGGLVTRGNPPDDPLTAPIEDVNLGSRLYLGIRAAGPSDGETARQGQERAVREVWRRVRELDYSRPGI